ncbi:hypothetical protein HMI56_000498 [Coelomomyces lativittatus]|nr:hypothetical protein HMI56_000498 [Coelomomyces lativittatus]
MMWYPGSKIDEMSCHCLIRIRFLRFRWNRLLIFLFFNIMPSSCFLMFRVYQRQKAFPKESTSAFLKKTFGITYPWLYKDTLPFRRLTDEELMFRGFHTNMNNLGIFGKTLLKFTKWIVQSSGVKRGKRFMTSEFGSDYYPNEFLDGVHLIAKPAIESLSYCPTQPSMFERKSVFYTQELIDRFQQEFHKLRNLKDIGIEIAVSKIHDVQIQRELLMEGPDRITNQIMTNPDYKIIDYLGGGRAIIKKSSESQGLISSYNFLPGVKLHIDVELLLDTSFTVYQLKPQSSSDTLDENQKGEDKGQSVLESTPIYHEFTGKRNLLLRLSSPWFKSRKEMVQVTEDEDGNQVRTWNWSWKVSDIDHLLLSEDKELE